jgi:hypothetical protein
MALRSHLLAAVAFGPYGEGELSYASALWSSVPDASLTILDRAHLGAPVLIPLQRGGEDRHWLTRAKKNTRWRVIEPLGPKDDLVELETSPESLQNDPSLPRTYQARAIRYQRKGFEPQVLLTSLVDATTFPAREIVALYHERWEIELGYDEIKTEMLDREEAIRSRTPEGVRQELWGILIAYNLIRLEMEHVAEAAKVAPNRISFVGAMRLISDEWLWCAISAHELDKKGLAGVFRSLSDPAAFRPEWFMSRVHVSPEEAVAAAEALGAGTALGMHFGTFSLADDG